MAAAAETTHRVLPHNLEAERSLLGAIVGHDAHLSAALRVIDAVDFYRDAHRLIFISMKALKDQKMAIDLVTLMNELRRVGMLDEVGGPSYVAGLVDGVPRSTNVEYYARIVREKSRLRGVIDAASKAASDAYDGEDEAAIIVERTSKELASHVRASADGLSTAHEIAAVYAMSLDDAETRPRRVKTGLADVDEIIRGMLPGDLVVVAARPSMGKTALSLCICDHVAKHFGPVGYFSLEMSKESIAPRILAMWTNVPSHTFESGAASEHHFERMGAALAVEPYPLLINFDARTITEIDAWCRKIEDDHGQLAAIAVDYLQLLSPERRTSRDDTDVADISHGLKRLAKDRHAPVIALSQLSRAPESRRDKRPQMSDLRGSGAIEQDCDLGMLIYRDEVYHPNDQDVAGLAEIIVAKHRNGPTGVARVCFLSEVSRFADLARHHDGD